MSNDTVLLVNHEQMLLDIIQSGLCRKSLRLWLQNGGFPTMNTYMILPQERHWEILELIQSMLLTDVVMVSSKSLLMVYGAPTML